MIFKSNHWIAAFSFMIVVVVASACVQQPEKPLTELRIAGHPQIYSFSYDLRESLKVPVQNKLEIQQLFSAADRVSFVWNGTSRQDNSYFKVVLINIYSKLSTYTVNEGKLMRFDFYYFVNDTWYNATDNEIPKPAVGTAIWLRGPETGADGTSVRLDGDVITLQGTSYKDLVLAGDRLVLVVFGIDSIDQIKGVR